MKKITTLLIAFFTIISTQIIWADPAQELSTLLSPIHTMQANFSQTVSDNRGRVLTRSYGRVSLARPGKFRWDVQKPIPQLIVANGSKLWIYDADLQQVNVKTLHGGANGTPALLLSQGDMNLSENYRVNKLSERGEWRWFSLTPRNRDNMFSNVQMGFMHGQIRQMRLRDQLGHQTAIQFLNPRFNVSMSPTNFIFKAPRQVDVIDETRRQR